MSTVEEEIISYIALSGDLKTVLEAGVHADHFLDPKNRSVFSSILAYKQDFGEAPTPQVVAREFPLFEFEEELSGPIAYLLRELHEARSRMMLELGLGAVAEAIDKGGTETAIPLLRSMLSQLALTQVQSQETDYAATGPDRLALYRQAMENPGAMLGFPTGSKFLDAVTLGIQKQQMIVLTGTAKSCKTTLMLHMSRTAHDHGEKPLMLSFEMPYLEIARRLDGFRAEINPKALQTGKVSEREWQRLEKALSQQSGEHEYLITEDRAGAMTISGLQAKIDLLNPSVVFLDGAYFLHDEITRESMTPLALTNISHGLKKMALDNDIPMVVTTQSLISKSLKGLTTNSLGYTSAWVMDADLVVGMEAIEDSPFAYRMKVLASRNAPPQEHLLEISWNPPRFEEADYAPEEDLPY